MSSTTPMMIRSMADLIGRCQAAETRRLAEFYKKERENDTNPSLFAGLPSPTSATNSHLREIEPLYQGLLSDKQKMMDLLECSVDSAILTLYVIEYPMMVRIARDTNMETMGEDFPWLDILTRISLESSLIKWCRAQLRLGDRHPLVYASCLHILRSTLLVAGTATPKKRRRVHALIFSDDRGSFLRDIGKCLARHELPTDGVVHGVCLGSCVLEDAPGSPSSMSPADMMALYSFGFEYSIPALNRERANIGEPIYHQLMIGFGGEISPNVMEVARQAPQPKPLLSLCYSSGCSNHASNMCSSCRLVSYCSRECQVAHWRHHRKVCNKSYKKGK